LVQIKIPIGFSTRNNRRVGGRSFVCRLQTDRARIFTNNCSAHPGLPGVQSAALARVGALQLLGLLVRPAEIEGYQPPRNEQVAAEYNQVGEGYFSTIRIPILTGQEFTRNDNENAPSVAIVNETMAAKYWPGKTRSDRLKVKDKWMESSVSRRFQISNVLGRPNHFFVPIRQNFVVQNDFIIRTDQSAAAIMNALAREIHALDRNLAPLDTITLQEQVDRMSYTQRLAVTLVAVFGGMALFLAAIGLYAVMSYAVSQSTRELGLRMALGAGASDLLRLVMSRGLLLTAGGVAVGAVVALALTRLMGNLLYQVSPRDPLAFGSAFVIMTIVAGAACFFPAWRATRIDPVLALRG
jgi:hypothetical protein